MSVLVYIAIGLESFVKRRVDIVSIDHVELLLKHTVLNYGELIYCRDHSRYVWDKWLATPLCCKERL